jgi:hypothetical protein
VVTNGAHFVIGADPLAFTAGQRMLAVREPYGEEREYQCNEDKAREALFDQKVHT